MRSTRVWIPDRQFTGRSAWSICHLRHDLMERHRNGRRRFAGLGQGNRSAESEFLRRQCGLWLRYRARPAAVTADTPLMRHTSPTDARLRHSWYFGNLSKWYDSVQHESRCRPNGVYSAYGLHYRKKTVIDDSMCRNLASKNLKVLLQSETIF